VKLHGWLLTCQASGIPLFSLNGRDAPAAIQALQTASRYDLALRCIGFIGRFGGLSSAG